MTPEQQRRVRDLFEMAVERDPADVSAWVEREAADDSTVRAEVLSLVQHHSRAGAFLSEPIVEHAPDLLADDGPLAPGARGGCLHHRSRDSDGAGWDACIWPPTRGWGGRSRSRRWRRT